MNGEAGFLVEDFLDAVSAQLDRTQDALAAKAKVRPLMFAVRTFAVDLQVFVSMGADGNVRLRSAAPGETGASTLKLEFTTITRPMVEENTVSLALAQAPSLTTAGLDSQQTRALERVGVNNVAQLQALHESGANVEGISRLTGGIVPVDRLRAALELGRPELFHIAPAPLEPRTPPPTDARPPGTPTPPVLRLPAGTRRLQLVGRNLLSSGAPPRVSLAGRPLETAEADDGRVLVDLPEGPTAGALEVQLDGGEPLRYHLRADGDDQSPPRDDPWQPEEER